MRPDSAVVETVQVAFYATAVSVVLGSWIGYFLVGRSRAAAVPSVFLILPPTIICAYFLFPAFNPEIAVAAAILAALPYAARSACLAFQSVDAAYLNAARIAGASEWRVFWRIMLPLSLRPVLSTALIVFGCVATEYAATLWIAGIHATRP